MKSHRYRERDVDMAFRRVAITVLIVAVGALAYKVLSEDSEAFGTGAAPTQVVPQTDTGALA